MGNYQTTPYPLAMVICDACHRDPATGKFFLLGLFSAISAPEFPCRHENMCVYFSFTDGLGAFRLRIEVVHVKDDDLPIFEMDIELPVIKDPRNVSEGTFTFQNLTFPEAGEYRLKLFANKEFLIERRIIVHQVRKAGESHE